MRSPSYGFAYRPPRGRHAQDVHLSRLGKTALVLGVLLELAGLLRLLPAAVVIALVLLLLAAVSSLVWHPVVTLAAAASVLAWRQGRQRRGRRAYEKALDDEIPF